MMRSLHWLLAAAVTLALAATAAEAAPGSATARASAPRSARRAMPLERDTLAWVGDRAVTALDLVQRIEWMPWMEKHGIVSMDSAKVKALEALVGEALLAEESEREHAADSAAIAPLRSALRRALTRDALYQQVVAEAPAPGPAQVERVLRATHPNAPPARRPALRKAVADSLRGAEGAMRAAQFLMHTLADQRVTVDSARFVRLADSLRAIVIRFDPEPVPGGDRLLPAEAPEILRVQLRDVLDQPLARFSGGALSIGDVLDDLHFYLFGVRSLERHRFQLAFNDCLRRIVEGELLAREGARRGLDRSPAVQRELERWTSAWRAEDGLRRIGPHGPATDDEAFRLLALTEPERARNLCEVDVSEILCGSRGEAAALLGELGLGARFDSLATARTRRNDWANHGGRSGFFPVLAHPELGYAALLSLPDTLVGPVGLPEGFALLRVHGKRLRADSSAAPALLARARAVAAGERRTRAIARHVAGLASHTRVEMNLAALRHVDILPANMVVKRSLGFGGGMMASPTLQPVWQWTRLWRDESATAP